MKKNEKSIKQAGRFSLFGSVFSIRLPTTMSTFIQFAISGVIFVSMSVLTLAAVLTLRELRMKHELAEFEQDSRTVEYRMRRRLSSNADILRAASGLFVASNEVTPEEWKNYVTTTASTLNRPGLIDFGFVYFGQALEKRSRTFSNQYDARKNDHFDVGSIISIYEAHHELTPNSPVMISPFEFSPTSENKNSLVLFIPVWKPFPKKVKLGWIHATLDAKLFLQDILQDELADMSFELTDVTNPSSPFLVFSSFNFSSPKLNLHQSWRLSMFGRDYLAHSAETSEIMAGSEKLVERIAFGCGSVVTVLLTLLSVSVLAARSDSERRVQKVTKELIQQQEERNKEREAAEVAVLRERDLFKQIIKVAPVNIALFDREMRYVAASQKWVENSKMKSDLDLLGKCHYDLFPFNSAERSKTHEKALLGETVLCDEDMSTLPGGEKMYFRSVFKPWRNPDNEICGIFIVTQEINDLVVAREQALENARQKSEFLACMSHEIRTPLNGAIGMTELLLETQLSDIQKQYASLALDASRSLMLLVNEILDFSKIEAGKMEIQHSPFSIEDCVSRCVALFERIAKEKEIQLVSSISLDPTLEHIGDAHLLGQVLLNVIGNALKFTEKGHVRVQVLSSPGIHKGQEASRVTISIQDTGIGMTQESLAKLFLPFSQADGSTSRRFGGSGLGLSISKRLVELMNGTILVESREGSGSTFTLDIPFPFNRKPMTLQNSSEHTNVLPAAVRSQRPQLFLNVLVAEDNLINQFHIRTVLEKMGCKVTIAQNGIEALHFANTEIFDVLLLDCHMPELDGYDTILELRKREETSQRPRLPTLAITANAMVGDKDRCLAAGMDDYLSKPIDRDILFQKLLLWSQKSNSSESTMPAQSQTSLATSLEKTAFFNDLDSESTNKLVRMFLANLPNSINEMKIESVNGNLKTLALISHTLKSNAAMFGASRLKTLCQKIEENARLGNLEAARSFLELIEIESVKVETEIKRHFPDAS